ncbi:MAG: carboxylesterase family protein [Alphaproteobacteria bacterium]|nr:carboxylesterase family protein [Alphaproteobacteria bacterium]MDE2072292.1 carboxylesterase/lipase family protein [Alphaproteobacteria bacterium]MDE2353287.1 carboxylesterase/lipase family protein [Alphaproteobacteria bacterium]
MTDGADNALFCAVETTAGCVQGLVTGPICQFKAIPYGAPTGGRNRFMPPRKPDGWRGLRECFGYGQVSPQVPTAIENIYGQLIHYDLAVAQGGMGEDCLHLNVWTPGLRDGGKRPVLVALHGGGFHISSGNGTMYDGAQLARQGNVVVVSVTHRLASFGFLDLVDAGAPEEFRHAGVAGVMDLVCALEWVRDNIENFGGDPDCVTIFGQSGGGWKTSVLLGTPAARGLFHRAAVQSGSQLRLQTRDEAAAASSALLRKLGLAKPDIAKISEVPWQVLLAAQTEIGALAFGPVLDGDYFTHHPFDPEAPAESADIPLIVSTTLDDAGLFFNNFDLDEAGLEALLAARYGAQGGEILRLYRRKWPDKPPFLLQAQIITDGGFRRYAYLQAEAKARQGRAPVYMYRWDFASPALGGRFGAVHASDVSASLANVRDAIVGAGTGHGRALCEALSAAWLAFAATGNPGTQRLPHWPAFDTRARAVMLLDQRSRVEHDPDAELRAFWTSLPFVANIYW